MDGNKDEALKCLKIGREALELGDRTRAWKFITKARRLDPNLPVDDLLSTLEEEESRDAPFSDAPTRSHGTRDEAPSSSLSKPGGNSSVRDRVCSIEYTEDQISIVRQVKKQKCYYDVLGLERNCSVEDVKKAYRKLSLKVHPDKNKAPGAEEAFKAVSKAFQCLSDEESRKRYDLVGSEEVEYERPVGRRGRAAAQGFNNGFYDAEFDADEIFRNFFFGGMPRTAATTNTQFGGFSFRNGMGTNARTRGDHGLAKFNVRALVQLLPILLVVLLNFLPSSEPIYSFSLNHPYVHRYSTYRGVLYYVKTAKFEQEYPVNSPDRIALEEEVERDYFSILGQNCRIELHRFQWGLIGETPNCDKLKQFEMVD